ncbi:mismatch-specific DNA-glycosylase [Brachybacterium nesterenkovii]|uniref:G:T/U mismatch-specific uracil/thymine DNA-glycosylase n=1 Tax=Brachybacterium nesterenkovii TaxID=47847 RepID=A0A1X6X510_9MICO|nr:mismatch-specific DNA-glycosylase [Brachybacterium nesterenkovii]SLM94067.1 G:T/U mismatch-specific uracil/thymine DNA-glycosylase [Brachybacterium nesterenkovii]
MTPRPTPADLEAARDAVVDDLLPDPLRLLIVGINPGLWTGATGAHFARPGNRFHPALAAAGITDRLIDPAEGYAPEDLAHLRAIGLGITNLVRRATARADELSDDELREGAARLVRTVLTHRPAAVAVAGITAYRIAFGERRARAGRQDGWPRRALEEAGAQAPVLEATPLLVVPNPSGLNAHETVASLAAAYREAADAAGMERFAPSR